MGKELLDYKLVIHSIITCVFNTEDPYKNCLREILIFTGLFTSNDLHVKKQL